MVSMDMALVLFPSNKRNKQTLQIPGACGDLLGPDFLKASVRLEGGSPSHFAGRKQGPQEQRNTQTLYKTRGVDA